MMRALLKLSAGRKSTRKLLDHFGDQFICDFYHYDEQRHRCFTTEERAQRQMVEQAYGNQRWLKFWLEQKGQCIVCGQELEYEGDRTFTISNVEWMVGIMRYRIRSCYTQTAIGKFINKIGDLRAPRPVTGALLKA